MWSPNGSTSYVCVSLGCPAGGLCLAESRVCTYVMTHQANATTIRSEMVSETFEIIITSTRLQLNECIS